jgi:transcriptional regulator with XRE-family HTH domain
METKYFRKLRLYRLLAGKKLTEVARVLRLPAYIVGAIERGEVAPSPRWIQRFEEVYGAEVAAELLAPVDAAAALGSAVGSLPR